MAPPRPGQNVDGARAGAYHRDAQLDDPEALRPGPAFSRRSSAAGRWTGRRTRRRCRGRGIGECESPQRRAQFHDTRGQRRRRRRRGPNEKARSLARDGTTRPVPGGQGVHASRTEEKDAKSTPAPGSTDAHARRRREGAIATRASQCSVGTRGPGRDGARSTESAAPGANARGPTQAPSSAPAFTMVGKTNDGRAPPPTRDIGPGEYDCDGADRPPGSSFTGVRGSKDGAYGDPTPRLQAGARAYPNAPRAWKTRPASRLPVYPRAVIDVPDERTKVGPGDPRVRGPGSTTRTGTPPRLEGPGDSRHGGPNPRSFDPAWIRRSGVLRRFHDRRRRSRVTNVHPRTVRVRERFQHTDRSDTPGPGEHAPRVFQFPARDDGESLSFVGAPPGYTIGVRRESNYPVRGHRSVGGPGEYHPEGATGSRTRSRGSPSAASRTPQSPRLPSRAGTLPRDARTIEREHARRPSRSPRFATETVGAGVGGEEADVSDRPTTTRNPAPGASRTNARPPTVSASGTTPDRRGSGEGAPPGKYAGVTCARPIERPRDCRGQARRSGEIRWSAAVSREPPGRAWVHKYGGEHRERGG